MKYSISQFNKQFPDDDACLEYVFKYKYGEGHLCPKCLKNKFYRVEGRKTYACACGYQIDPLSDTIFNKSSTSLKLWFLSIYLFSQTRRGVPAKELQRVLGVTYKTAWRMGHKIRELMEQDMEKSEGVFEADETFIGGKTRRAGGCGWRKNKIPVFGILKREGKVFAVVVRDIQKLTLSKYIFSVIDWASDVMTDESHSYDDLGRRYNHFSVCHSKREYVRGNVSTNGIEGFWSQLKKLYRCHHWISGKWLQWYVNEAVFRYNCLRSGIPIFPALLSRVVR